MNLVLYRKHRPQSLADLVGQTPIVMLFKVALAKHRQGESIGHAFLLTGPRGVGKTSLARILAHEINQIPYSLNVIPLDIIEIDAASNRRIEEIRDLREKIKLMPLELTYKIYIIDEVHMLTPEAFNALLKTLEEPPEHIIFILATTALHKVPPTIISRCQHFALNSITVEVLAKHLQKIAKLEKIKLHIGAARSLAEYAQGSLRDALNLLDQLGSLKQPINQSLVDEILNLPPQKMIDNLLQALLSHDFQQFNQAYNNLVGQGIDSVILASQLSRRLRAQLKLETDPQARTKIVDILEDLLKVFNAPKPQASLEIMLLKHTIN